MKRFAAIITALALAGAGIYYWKAKGGKADAPSFDRAEATRTDIRVVISATGEVKPQNRLQIKPPIAGRVETVMVREGMRVKKGQVLAWMSSTERAALLDAAGAKGPDEVKHWELLYKPAPLMAPLNGVVIARDVEPGQTVTAQDALFVMSDRLIVQAQVDETDIGRIRVEQPVSLSLDAYPNKPFAGSVSHIAYEATTVNNVTIYEVEVLPDGVPEFMRSGMTANIEFLVEERQNVLAVPSEAIQHSESGPYVMLPGAQNAPLRQPVRAGLSDGKQTEIAEGLKEGDVVLVPSFDFTAKKNGGKNPFMPNRRRDRSPSGTSGASGRAR